MTLSYQPDRWATFTCDRCAAKIERYWPACERMARPEGWIALEVQPADASLDLCFECSRLLWAFLRLPCPRTSAT